MADAEADDRFPRLVNNPYTLMAKDSTGMTTWYIAAQNMQIGPANGGLCYSDYRIGG